MTMAMHDETMTHRSARFAIAIDYRHRLRSFFGGNYIDNSPPGISCMCPTPNTLNPKPGPMDGMHAL